MSGQLRLDTLFALQRKRGADEAGVDAPLGDMQRFAAPEKRCTRIIDGHGTRCKWWFPEADEHDWCKTCRSKALKYWHGEKHDHHLEVKATYRAEHKEQIAESGATYRAEHKEQIAEYNDTYRAEHAEQIAESSARYRANHQEQIAESGAVYRANHKEQIAESHAIYRAEHKEQIAESGAVYRANHKEQIAEYKATYRAEHAEQIKAYSDAWNNSDAGRESKARYRASAAGAAARARERASGKKKLANARYREKHADRLKEKHDEWNRSPMGLLCRSLHKMVAGAHWNPQSFPALGSFQSNEEARAHFESFFEASGWMTWENRGAHQKGNEYDQVWNIGHWLPRAIFDPINEEDLRRCWHPDNLFPQCAKANTEYRDVLIYTDEELLERLHLWPVSANDDLDQLKGLFRYTAV
jgi:hypothetical protein